MYDDLRTMIIEAVKKQLPFSGSLGERVADDLLPQIQAEILRCINTGEPLGWYDPTPRVATLTEPEDTPHE